MSRPIETVKSFYDALARGDAAAGLGLLTPDMEWSVVAGWPYKPNGRGPQAVAEGVLMPVLKEWRDYKLHGSDMFEADGGKVVSVGVMTGVNVTTGKALEAAYVHIWETVEGRIVRMRQTVDTARVVEARS
jgi:ketosteroid isomerase-like protein